LPPTVLLSTADIPTPESRTPSSPRRLAKRRKTKRTATNELAGSHAHAMRPYNIVWSAVYPMLE
ncbi:MAG: hypothetical protein NTZ05_19890, partial [Chloroflexi bacterium]|nr:hypothetical protein [Chloroflexota bacterium]